MTQSPSLSSPLPCPALSLPQEEGGSCPPACTWWDENPLRMAHGGSYSALYGPEEYCMLKTRPGEGHGTPLQSSCLENPMDGGAWWTAVHGVTKSQTRLSDFTFTFHFHALEKEMATHSSVLAWRIPGTGSLVGCRLWGRTESDTTEAT